MWRVDGAPQGRPDHKAPEGQDVCQEAIPPGRHRARVSAWASAHVGSSAIYPSGLSAKLPAESASAEALPPGTRQKAGTLAAGPGDFALQMRLRAAAPASSLLPGAFSGRSARPPDARLDTLFRSVRPQRGQLPSPCLPSVTRQKADENFNSEGERTMSTTTLQHTHATSELIDFPELHKKYAERLLASMINITKNREAAEDAAAAAFAKAFDKRNTFRGESSAYTWLHAIAVNEAIAPKNRRREASLDAYDCDWSEPWTAPDLEQAKMEQSDCGACLRKILRGMPAKYRQVLMDHFLRDLTVRQIARRRKLPLGTALSRLFKAQKLLKKAWEYSSYRCRFA
jgi:RNA polymerase sigma-70 factor (ECF subfamily)